MNRWIIADTHFGHKNVIQYCERPFSSVEEMNEELIKKWNSVVKPDDIVYHLGDFSMTSNKEKVAELVACLNGRIVLIMGNHDQKSHRWYMDCGFENTTRKPMIVDNNIILMHEPPMAHLISPIYYYVFGHVHEKVCLADNFSNCRCVSAERINYTPINFKEIINERNRTCL